MFLLVVLLLFWLINAFVAMMVLDDHDKGSLGFLWGFFFGPLGVLISVITATSLNRDKSDRETRELLRQDIATRAQMVERAVVAALAVHLPQASLSAPFSTAPTPTAPANVPTPAARSYDEIMADEPTRPQRRFR
jgi:hypothetical protein